MMLFILYFPPYLLNSILFTVTCTITKKLLFTNFEKPVPWEIAGSDDIDSWWESWMDLFFAAVSTDFPMVQWCRSKMNCWLSPSTIKAVKLRCIVYHKLKCKPSDCYLVHKLTRKHYQAYVEEFSNTMQTDQKHF